MQAQGARGPDLVGASRLAGRLLGQVLLAIPVAWATLAILLAGGGPGAPGWGRMLLAATFAGGCVASVVHLAPRHAVGAIAAGLLTVLAWWSTIEPSNERHWPADLVVLPWAEIDGPIVTLHEVRDFRYRSVSEWEEGWYDAVYDTRQIEGIDFFLVHFSEFKGIGHTMVSFRFADGRFVSVSVETRREMGETYGVLRGLFRQYELAYVVGDERDLVQLRTNHRRNEVYRFPGRGSREQFASYFLDVCRRLNELRVKPEFYNSFTNNCTTNLVRHWEWVTGRSLPFDYRILLPGYVDGLAFDLGLIDTDLDLEETRRIRNIKDRALQASQRDDFSLMIRK